MDEAILTLKHVLEQDETFADGHLLLAQIHQYKGNHATSSQYLDTALSFNFAVSILFVFQYYVLLNARIKFNFKIKHRVNTVVIILLIFTFGVQLNSFSK